MIEVAPGQKHGHTGARQGPDLGVTGGTMNSLGACWVSKFLGKAGTGHPVLQRARKRRWGRSREEAPSHSRDADPL